jgi:hypothetical protein
MPLGVGVALLPVRRLAHVDAVAGLIASLRASCSVSARRCASLATCCAAIQSA